MENIFDELSKDVTIINEFGLHARSAGKIAKIAQNTQADVWIIKQDEKVDAKSIMDILTLACAKGSMITIKIDDPSDLDILEVIVKLVEKGFGE